MKRLTFLLVTVAALGGGIGITVPVTLHSGEAAAPIHLTKIPGGYRDWRVISAAHEEGNLNSFVAVLANDVAIKAYREEISHSPDGAIISALHYGHAPSEENNKSLWPIPITRCGSHHGHSVHGQGFEQVREAAWGVLTSKTAKPPTLL